MVFTIVRSVREAESTATHPPAKLPPLLRAAPTPIAPERMDLPFAEVVLHLDMSDFAETAPGNCAG